MARQWWLRNSPHLLPCQRPALYLVLLAHNTVTTSEISAALVFQISAPMSPSQTDPPTTHTHTEPPNLTQPAQLSPQSWAARVFTTILSQKPAFCQRTLFLSILLPPLGISKPLKREHRPNHTTNKAFFILFYKMEEKHISQVICLEGSGT